MPDLNELYQELARLRKLPITASQQAILRVQQQIAVELKKQNKPVKAVEDINSTIGGKIVSPALTDTGDFSMVALQKRQLQKFTDLNLTDFSTSAKQDTGNAFAASIYGVTTNFYNAAATAAKQDTGNASLVSILSKIIAAPATEAKQDALNSLASAPIQTRAISRFYNIRGQRYISTTGYIQQTLNITGEAIALLKNPSGSGQVLLFDKAEFGTTASCRFSRYGGGTTPLVGTPTARPIGRTDGGTSTSTMELYTGGNSSPQFSISGGSFVAGTLRKVAAMLAYDTYQLLEMDGTAVLQPGQQVYWIVDEIPGGGAGNFYTFIDLEWVEMPVANWTAMVTALQAKSEY